MTSEAQKRATAKYREANKEKIKAKQAAWRAANQEKIKALREAYKSNPENKKKILSYNDEWRNKNPDKRRAQSARYLIKHADDRREYRRKNAARRSLKTQEWNRANAEHKKAYMAAYQKANPEKFQEVQQRRRAIMRNAPVGERKAICQWIKEWRSLREVECHWCHGKFHPVDCHSDHVIPLGRDGAHCRSNMVIACKKCNVTKNKQDLETWMRRISL